MACLASEGAQGFLASLMSRADCQADALALGGYDRLTAYGGMVPALVASALALYVAFQGWRLTSGRLAPMGNWTFGLLKIGFVLALVTQWSTYETLVAGVLTRAPTQVSQVVLDGYQARLGQTGDLIANLQRAHDVLSAAAAQGAPTPSVAPASTSLGAALQPPVASTASPPPAAASLRAAALILLLSSAGLMVAARIVLAILLALGPLVLILMLFNAASGLLTGWLRAGIALALVTLLANVALAAELALLAPTLRELVAHRGEAAIEPALGSAALLVTSIFAFVAVAICATGAIVASALRPPWRPAAQGTATAAASALAPLVPAGVATPRIAPRSDVIAQSFSSPSAQRREARLAIRAEPATAQAAGRPLLVAYRDERLSTIRQSDSLLARRTGGTSAGEQRRRDG